LTGDHVFKKTTKQSSELKLLKDVVNSFTFGSTEKEKSYILEEVSKLNF